MKKSYNPIAPNQQERRKVSKTFTVRLHNYEDDQVTEYHRDVLSDAEFLAVQKSKCDQVSRVEILRTERYETLVGTLK